MRVMACVCLVIIKGKDFFLSLQYLNGLSVMHIIFWFNSYSIIKLFHFSTASVERFSGLGEKCCKLYFPNSISVRKFPLKDISHIGLEHTLITSS